MLPAAGLTSGHTYVAAFRGAPIIGSLTYQDESRAHAYEKAQSAMLPALAPLMASAQQALPEKQYAR